ARLLPRLRSARAAALALRATSGRRDGGAEAGRDPHASGGPRHGRGPRPPRRHGRPPLLLLAAPARAGARARLVRVLRRQRHLPEGGRSPTRRGAGAARAADGGDGFAVPRAPAGAGPPQRAGPRDAHTCGPRRHPRRRRRRARVADRAQRGRVLRPAVSATPKKELGQHFLVDENILGVIGRLAELAATDSVLEIGPGLGVLTRYLAPRVARVHAVELDRSLEPELRDLPANVDLHFGDALQLDLA